MNINHVTLRKLFKDFWIKHDHKEIPPIPLVPKDDPTTLFTGSGMQQLVPYLLGEPHPLGKRLFDIQPCLRAQDIEEVGDNRHDTFFEMMGNWSLGDYFKKEQLAWCWEFFTRVLKLPKEKLYVTVFKGTKEIPADNDSYQIWKEIGLSDEKIFRYEDNWWSRAGSPDKMPVGEPGGPDSEIFYEFSNIPNHPNCHPNCQCGRFLEIGNSVFMQYKKNQDGSFSELPTMNVDFGGGLERILAALNNDPDIFKTDVFFPIIKSLEQISKKEYSKNKKSFRIIADHLKAATFLQAYGVIPNSKDKHGAVVRKLLDKVVEEFKFLDINIKLQADLINSISLIYNLEYPIIKKDKKIIIGDTVNVSEKIKIIISTQPSEVKKEVPKLTDKQEAKRIIKNNANKFHINFEESILNSPSTSLGSVAAGTIAFDVKTSHGYPVNETKDYVKKILGTEYNEEQFNKTYETFNLSHKQLSKKGGEKLFKGGLANHSEQTLKYHTATHLLHQALFDVLGADIRQEGSNITNERLRFDFYSTQKPTNDQIKKVESIVNEKIDKNLEVFYKIVPKDEAMKIGAKSFFREKYPDMVKVYFVGNYSKEFCGGPHVKNTKEIGKISVYKFEKIGSNLYRIYAK